MSTPPKYLQGLQARDKASLLSRLEALADKWDTQASVEDLFPVRISTLNDCIKDLRDFIEDARA